MQPISRYKSASAAIDTYSKVRRLQSEASEQQAAFADDASQLQERIRRRKPQAVVDYVAYLADVRKLQGKAADLKSTAYVEAEEVEEKKEEETAG